MNNKKVKQIIQLSKMIQTRNIKVKINIINIYQTKKTAIYNLGLIMNLWIEIILYYKNIKKIKI